VGKKRQKQVVLSVLMMVILLMGMIPGVAFAAVAGVEDQNLAGLQFMASTDSTLIVGETSNINVKLFQDKDSYDNPFTGAATAIITDPNGNGTMYPISGNYTISNVTLDTPGDYKLSIVATFPSSGSVIGTLNVVNAVTKVTGSLFINTNNLLSVKVTDTDGNPLDRRSVTVDGTAVGATAPSFTTLSDGTFTLQMTPTSYGTVNITHAGHVIGTIPVVPAYTQNARIGGTSVDNASLAVDVSKSGWAQGTRKVILARDDEFADAMAAVPLSKYLNAPILMTDSKKLDDRAFAEMQRLGVTNVYIVGGPGAISEDVENQLKDHYAVTRIFGRDRYDTAVEISKYVGIEATHTVYIANGYAIPDAVAASAFAAEQGSPILLTGKDQIPTSTLDALANLNASNVVLLGGTGVISPQVKDALSAKYVVKQWGGNDRYDTQNIIFQNLLNTQTQTPQSPLYFASGLVRQDDVSSGKPHADALLTAALAAKTGGFVAMVPQSNLPSSLNFFLLFNKGYISKAGIVGNNSGVSSDIEQEIQQMLSR
jgi:putative cell wall-binding protein